MSYANCIRSLTQAAGRTLTDEEVLAIYQRVHRAAFDIKSGRASAADIYAGKKVTAIAPGAPADDLVRAAAERAAADLMHEANVKLRQANLQVVASSARFADIGVIRDAGLKPIDAVIGTLMRNYSGKLDVTALEVLARGHNDRLQAKLMDTWDALGDDWLGLVQDRQKVVDVLHELRGEDTGNAVAKKGAKAFADAAEIARLMFNERGGDVGRLEDWSHPQHHSQKLVASAANSAVSAENQRAWVDYIFPMLNRSKYVDDLGTQWTDVEVRDFLDHAWWTIATDGHYNQEPGKYPGAGKTANRHAEHRQIHFKDAESVVQYWDKFGDRTPVEIMRGHLATMARDIAFIEHYGPNPDMTFRSLLDTALRDETIADPRGTEAAEGRAIIARQQYDYVSGRTAGSLRPWLSSTVDGITQLNVAAKLGGAALASLYGDKPMMEAVGHLNDLPMLQRWRTELSYLNPLNESDRRLLRSQGLMLEGIVSGLNRFYEGLGDSRWTGKLANVVMRVTGMTAINDIRKGAWGASLMNTIGGEIAAGRDFTTLHASDIRALRTWGITEQNWKVWQLARLDDYGHGNNQMLTPAAIERISDADLRRVFAPDLQKQQAAVGDQIAKLMERNAKVDEQAMKQVAAIKEAEARAAERLNRFMTTRDARLAKAGEMAQAQIEALQARIERAEAQADVEAYLLQQRVRNESTDLAVDMMRQRDPQAALERTDVQGDRASRQRGAIGEEAGELRGRAERRIIEAETRLRNLEREADAEIRAKYRELAGDIQQRITAADRWYEGASKRVERRNAVIDRMLRDASATEAKALARYREDAVVKLLGAVNTESEFAIVTPGWKERSEFYAGSQRGSFGGEFRRAFLQFKMFPWALFHRGLDAIANAETTFGKYAMGAYIVAATTLAGAMLLQTREMLSGKDPRAMLDEKWWKFWGQAFVSGGALGIYGDFLYGVNKTRYGTGPLEAFVGPTIGPLLELGVVQPMNALSQVIQGKETHFLAQQAQDLKGFLPGSNIWYLKGAFENMVWGNVLEMLSPGYISAQRSRMQREFGQDRWWDQGEMMPHRAPDLGAAVRQ